MSNLTRVLEGNLEQTLPTATEVRKMSTTAVARKCSEHKRNVVARSMNHDPKTSLSHYQATRSSKDAVDAFNTIKSLCLHRLAQDSGCTITSVGQHTGPIPSCTSPYMSSSSSTSLSHTNPSVGPHIGPNPSSAIPSVGSHTQFYLWAQKYRPNTIKCKSIRGFKF